ncbi:MAG: YggS family pyridoxal phosphate-dependent enzyme, partial [Proteobacteria bacterium]|nr:YggS family pyridoxal phosphate-dependent enzyme [Pseudomonadota bacterium]
MIAHNIKIIKEKINEAAENAGRRPQDIKLVAVSKRFSVDSIHEAFAAGQNIFGENYIQEIQAK